MAKKLVESNILIENAKLIFRNFKGEKSKYNKNGLRTFCVLLDEDQAQMIVKDGWNVKWLQPQEEGDPEQAYLNVKVQYGRTSPKIVTVTSFGRTYLGEEEVAMLDWAEFENVDLSIRPYNWEVSGKTGVAAYLKTMYATLVEDEFEAKYRDVPSGPPISDDEPPWKND